MGKLEIYGIAALLILLAIGAAEFHGRHEGRLAERHDWEVKAAEAQSKDFQALKDAVNAAAEIGSKTYNAVQAKRGTNTIDRGVIEREIRTDVRYVNDCLPDNGRLLWNSVSAGRALMPIGAGTGKPAGNLPDANGAGGGGQQGRDPAAKPSGRP